MKHSQTCIRILADEAQIKACKKLIHTNEQAFSKLSRLLALAGNEVRLKVLFLLEEEKELCPCDLADILEMSIPAVSQHLRKMKDGDLVRSRRKGQTIFYSLNVDHLALVQPFFKHVHHTTTKELA